MSAAPRLGAALGEPKCVRHGRMGVPGLTLFAVLVAACVPAHAGSEACQTAMLRNGFAVQFGRREAAGPATRLWLCEGAGFVEIPTEQIQGFAQGDSVAAPAPAPRVSLPAVPLKDLIADAALRHRIDPDFVASVVKAESGFVPTAVSPKGAGGLMQLMPQTAAKLGVKNVLDPAANVEGGTKYLRQLLELYKGDAVKALAAYNAGPQRVEQYGGIPPYRETQAYVARIVDDYNRKKLQAPATTADK